MGVARKVYMIVTNDKYETIVKMDLYGLEEVSKELNMPMNTIAVCIHRNRWNKRRKYKAIIDEEQTREEKMKAHAHAVAMKGKYRRRENL